MPQALLQVRDSTEQPHKVDDLTSLFHVTSLFGEGKVACQRLDLDAPNQDSEFCLVSIWLCSLSHNQS